MSDLRKKIIYLLLAIFLVAGFNVDSFSAIAKDDEDDIKKSLNKTQEQIDKEEKELQQSQSNLNVTQSQINTTAGILSQTKTELSKKEQELNDMENRIELNRNILIAYAQQIYYGDQEENWALALNDNDFNDYFENLDQILNTKEKILAVIDEINSDKEKSEKIKNELAEKKEQHEDVLADKQAEKNEIVADINETKLTIAQLQAKLSKLRSTLSKFLGGSYSMDDVIDAVKFAEKKTGVRKQFLFAMLDKETDLGRFTGGCTFKNSKMGSKNESIFKDICKKLGYDYKKKKVSCPLSYGIGGAMGVAQFMPTTWTGYNSKISAVTGNKPADPWNLEDGIVGMALKLKAAGGNKKSGEYKAAATYYCGSRLYRTVCKNYANTVISWSKGYDDYF
jgi:peptidoglycan hydrolase CwlO-like protein